jgi:hypothetical protein
MLYIRERTDVFQVPDTNRSIPRVARGTRNVRFCIRSVKGGTGSMGSPYHTSGAGRDERRGNRALLGQSLATCSRIPGATTSSPASRVVLSRSVRAGTAPRTCVQPRPKYQSGRRASRIKNSPINKDNTLSCQFQREAYD